jgi:hypothetical protein
MVAQHGVSEAMWWNPAGLASLRGREVSLNHSQSLVGTGDALTAVVRTRFGVLGVGANLLQNDGGDVTGDDSLPAGQLYPRNLALVGSYALSLGRRVRVGASLKHVQLRFDCSGECPPNPTVLASTAAFDVGGQVSAQFAGIPVVFGLAFRHLGTDLATEIADEEGPARGHAGVAATYQLPSRWAPDAAVSGTLDLAMGRGDRRPLPRFGAELEWADAVFLRGGFVLERSDSESGGASLGIGFRVRQRLQVDFSRDFSGLSADAGQPPVQLGLRIIF